ncbi:MAG: ABC transporter ATP-binding protein [Myxococcota bacterium]
MSRVRLAGDGVEKRFGRVTALAGIDFVIEPGESVAILGANGAGKSTWLRILAGLAKPSGGRFVAERVPGPAAATVAGSPSASSTPPTPRPPSAAPGAPLAREALRGRVGYVGHATLLSGELTARENVVFAARLHGLRPTRAEQDALFAELGLEEFADRRVASMSRGTAQRVSIARGVVHAPDVLLLDEPFTGLDERSATRLSGQLAQLRQRGCSLVVVTHDPQRAVELADRALLLHRGRLRATPRRQDGDAFSVEALRRALSGLADEDRRTTARHEVAGGDGRGDGGPDDPHGGRSVTARDVDTRAGV